MTSQEIKIMHSLPKEIETIEAQEIRQIFDQPTLIKLGEGDNPLLVSVLLHGNELTGFRLLKQLSEQPIEGKRPLWIWVANIWACEAGLRHLPEQPDFNRIWKNPPEGYQKMVDQYLKMVEEAQPFAVVDVHNNTGRNPFYACVTSMQTPHLHLASLFTRTIVHFINPDSVLICQTNKTCPSVVLECGPTDNLEATGKVYNYLHDLLNIRGIGDVEREHLDIHVFKTIGRMTVDPKTSIHFGIHGQGEDIEFVDDLQNYNFAFVQSGALVARVNGPQNPPIQVFDDDGNEISHEFFLLEGDKLLVKKEVFPSMLTNNIDIVKNDCLGYLMKEIPVDS